MATSIWSYCNIRLELCQVAAQFGDYGTSSVSLKGQEAAVCADLHEIFRHPTTGRQRLHLYFCRNVGAELVQVNVARRRENERLLAPKADIHLSCLVFAATPPRIAVRESVVDIVAGDIDVAALHRMAIIWMIATRRKLTACEIDAVRVLRGRIDLQAPDVPRPGRCSARHKPQAVGRFPNRLQPARMNVPGAIDVLIVYDLHVINGVVPRLLVEVHRCDVLVRVAGNADVELASALATAPNGNIVFESVQATIMASA